MPGMPESRRHQLAGDQLLTPSVLVRLIVRAGDSPRSTGGQVLGDFRESVRRDLQDLLNTRPCCQSWPANLKELDDSLVNYGLPDFTGPSLSAPANQMAFRRHLQRVVEAFEPRLKSVSVELMSKAGQLNRTLSFHIKATLCIEPFEERISFDSTIEPVSASFAVSLGRTDEQRASKLL